MILYILSKLGPKYSVFVSTFHSGNITIQNWGMPILEVFMESLTQEQDKLVQLGTIKYTKDHALVVGVLNQSKGNNKSKDSKQQEKKNSDVDNSSSTGEDLKPKRMKIE